MFKIKANFELNGKAKVCVQGIFHTLETRIILKKRVHFIHERSRGQRKTNGELMVYWRGPGQLDIFVFVIFSILANISSFR